MPHASWGGPGLSRTVRVHVPGGGIQLNVHPELEVIMATLVARLDEVRRRFNRGPLYSSGGYNKRLIAGTGRWSNHSWGLAGDFCAGENPYQYILRTDFPIGETRRIAAELGFRWGLDYGGKKDPMHFEYMGTREDARALTARLRPPAPVPPKPAPAPTPAPAPEDEMRNPQTVRPGDRGQVVRNLQGLLMAAGRTLPGGIDGSFGPGTERVLREWQGAAGQPGGPDGTAGPWTWGTLLGTR